jgi:mannose/fructose-specific phosphotransferase system component IIA
MSEEKGIRGILLAHGSMAVGLADAVRKISGVGPEVLIPISNEGKSPQALEEEIARIMGDEPMILFTDLPSGSCAFAARRCSQGDCDQAVVSGVNLPILLDFVFNRHLPLGELLPRLVEKGTGAMKTAPVFPRNADSSLPS